MLAFFLATPVKPEDPPVAPTVGFFLDSWQPKAWERPDAKPVPAADAVGGGAASAASGTASGAAVTIRVDVADVLAKIPPVVYGHNANTWMTAMITEPVFMRHVWDLRPHVIRWPAGSGSDGYFWNRAPGDLPADVPVQQEDKNGKKTVAHYFFGRPKGGRSASLDDYYEMRRETGNEGLITINYGYARYGTGPNPVATAAHLAADWVRYDHGRTKYWEIGNENYGDWELGYRIDTTQNKDGQPEFLTGRLYARHFKVFADSMREAAAETGAVIYIGAVTAEGPAMRWESRTRKTWNEQMLPELAGAADFYVLHNYFTAYKKNLSAAEILYDAETVPAQMMQYVTKTLEADGAPLKPIAMDEWNMFAAGSMQQVSNISGVFADIVIGEALKNKYGLVCRWDLLNAWDGGNDHGLFSAGDEPGVARWSPRPSYYYLYFMQKMQGDRLVATEVQGDTSLRAYGSTFSSGEVNVTVVNTAASARKVKIDVPRYAMGSRYYWYSLEGGDDNGEFSRRVFVNGHGPAAVAGGPDDYAALPAWSAAAAGGVSVTVPGHGAVCLTIEKQ